MINYNPIQLITSSGSQSADDAVCGLIGIFEMRFPGRIRAFYAEGSYADRTAIASSDIDLIVIFKDRFADKDEAGAARQLGAYCANLSAFELDLTLEFENHFLRLFKPFVLGELYGDDAEARHAAVWLLGQIPYEDDQIERALREQNASAIQENLL
jgi:predicted nucleotidyltransferase